MQIPPSINSNLKIFSFLEIEKIKHSIQFLRDYSEAPKRLIPFCNLVSETLTLTLWKWNQSELKGGMLKWPESHLQIGNSAF